MISDQNEAAVSVLDEDSVDVVIMHEDSTSGRITPCAAAVPVKLDEAVEPAAEVLAALLDSTVRLVAPTDVSPDVIRSVQSMPVPRLFAASGWLLEHRALVFLDGHCQSGSLVIRFAPEVGLSVDGPAG